MARARPALPSEAITTPHCTTPRQSGTHPQHPAHANLQTHPAFGPDRCKHRNRIERFFRNISCLASSAARYDRRARIFRASLHRASLQISRRPCEPAPQAPLPGRTTVRERPYQRLHKRLCQRAFQSASGCAAQGCSGKLRACSLLCRSRVPHRNEALHFAICWGASGRQRSALRLAGMELQNCANAPFVHPSINRRVSGHDRPRPPARPPARIPPCFYPHKTVRKGSASDGRVSAQPHLCQRGRKKAYPRVAIALPADNARP